MQHITLYRKEHSAKQLLDYCQSTILNEELSIFKTKSDSKGNKD